MNPLTTPQGSFTLNRYPLRNKETLRGWDAADEYLLNYLHENVKDNNPRILIINDSFGALSCALHSYTPTIQTDSFLAFSGIKQNLKLNNLNEDTVTLLNSNEALEGIFDIVIIKAPKSHAYLEDILCKLKPHINNDTQVISAAMAKNIHSSTLTLYEKILGKTTTSLAKKKARLIFTKLTNNEVNLSPYPINYELELGDNIFSITNEANVFSRDKLDIGTRFFLEHLPVFTKFKTIVDLGCGNGLLGVIAAQANPDASLILTDESYMAIASARQNFESAFGTERSACFLTTDCLQGVDKNSADLVLCNPPFHQNHTVGDHIAWQMFKEAYAVLKQGGEFWIVGNHHMAYHSKLKKIFGGYTVVASNKKFAVMFSRKNEKN